MIRWVLTMLSSRDIQEVLKFISEHATKTEVMGRDALREANLHRNSHTTVNEESGEIEFSSTYLKELANAIYGLIFYRSVEGLNAVPFSALGGIEADIMLGPKVISTSRIHVMNSIAIIEAVTQNEVIDANQAKTQNINKELLLKIFNEIVTNPNNVRIFKQGNDIIADVNVASKKKNTQYNLNELFDNVNLSDTKLSDDLLNKAANFFIQNEQFLPLSPYRDYVSKMKNQREWEQFDKINVFNHKPDTLELDDYTIALVRKGKEMKMYWKQYDKIHQKDLSLEQIKTLEEIQSLPTRPGEIPPQTPLYDAIQKMSPSRKTSKEDWTSYFNTAIEIDRATYGKNLNAYNTHLAHQLSVNSQSTGIYHLSNGLMRGTTQNILEYEITKQLYPESLAKKLQNEKSQSQALMQAFVTVIVLMDAINKHSDTYEYNTVRCEKSAKTGTYIDKAFSSVACRESTFIASFIEEVKKGNSKQAVSNALKIIHEMANPEELKKKEKWTQDNLDRIENEIKFMNEEDKGKFLKVEFVGKFMEELRGHVKNIKKFQPTKQDSAQPPVSRVKLGTSRALISDRKISPPEKSKPHEGLSALQTHDLDISQADRRTNALQKADLKLKQLQEMKNLSREENRDVLQKIYDSAKELYHELKSSETDKERTQVLRKIFTLSHEAEEICGLHALIENKAPESHKPK